MFDLNPGFEMSVYILWGMGVLGLVLKLMANIHMKRMIKASGNMATTKRRALRIMRLKYINGKSLGINTGSSASFVDKNVRSLRYLGLPLYVWRRTGFLLSLGIAGMVSGAFLYNDISWRGSPEMVELIANGICVCAFLMIIENIFLINNKLEILKANIRDYLDNVPGCPKNTVDIITKPEPALKDIRSDNVIDATPHIKSVAEDETESDEAVLNSFLKEFFS